MTNPLNNRDKSKVAEMANADDLLEEIPEEEEVKNTEEEEEENPEDEKSQPKEEEEEIDKAEEEEEEEENKEPVKVKAESKEEPSSGELYKEQRKTAQLLHERNKQLTDAFLKADEVVEPTEDELKKYISSKGADIEELTAFEKQMAKDSLINSRRLEAVQGAVRDVKHIDEWANKVDIFLDDNERTQTNKNLIGREPEFRRYAMKADFRGLPVDMILSHFLMTNTKSSERREKRPPLFATNGGGERPKAKRVDKITDADQAARLRTSDPRELKRRLLSGQVDIEV